MKFFQCKCFSKDIKDLSKTCKHLKEFVKEHITETANKKLELQVKLFEIEGFVIYKTRMKDCNQKGSSGGYRIIWAFNSKNKTVLFIRIYHKSKVENILKTEIKSFLIDCLQGEILDF